MDRRSEHNAMVEADLPFECILASEMSTSDVGIPVHLGNWNSTATSSSSSGQDLNDCFGAKSRNSSKKEARKLTLPQIELLLQIRTMVICK